MRVETLQNIREMLRRVELKGDEAIVYALAVKELEEEIDKLSNPQPPVTESDAD